MVSEDQITLIKHVNTLLIFLIELDIAVVEFDQKIVDNFINLKVGLEKQGSRLEDFDLTIGATALVNDLVLVTKNRKHFSRIADIKLYS